MIDILHCVLLMLRGFTASIPEILEEQAATLGANRFQIIVPLVLPARDAALVHWLFISSAILLPFTMRLMKAMSSAIIALPPAIMLLTVVPALCKIAPKRKCPTGRPAMATWTSRNPCPNCGRKSGYMMKCSTCGKMGCPGGACNGALNATCKTCRNGRMKKI